MKKISAFLSVSIAALSLTARAQEKVNYNDQVLPIFRNACLNCHNPDKKKAGLDLSTYQATLQGSENGKILQSGNAGASLLLKCVKGTEDPKMPPKGDKLTDAEIGVIEKWIVGQLLETANGKAVAAAANNVAVAVVSLERPDGPPPMPGDLPLEPFLKVTRKNALVALASSPWAPLVAIGGQKQVILYNTETLEPLGVLPFPEGFPSIIRFSRNGQLLLTGGGQGGKSGKVVLWDIKTGERVATVGNEFDSVLGADISADQQFVALGGPNKLVKIYSTKDGHLVQSIKKHTDWVTAVAYSPDGQYLASADRNGGIQIWEGKSGKEFNTLPGHKVMVTSLAFMSGVIASASEDGTIKLWDIKEAKEIRSWAAHPGGTEWVDFSPDGRLVSCGRDKISKVWDQTGKLLGKSEAFGDITLRTALANDRVITGDWSGDIRVFNLEGKQLGQLSANPLPIADNLNPAKQHLAEAQTAADTASKAFAAADQAFKAEQAAALEKKQAREKALETAKTTVEQTEKRLTDEKAALAELQKAKDAAPEPERATAQQKVDEQAAKIAKTDVELGAGKKAFEALKTEAAAIAAAPVKAGPAEGALAAAKAANDQAAAGLLAANTSVQKWTRAQAYMGVHNAHRTLLEQQALYAQLVATARDALLPAEQNKGDIEAAEKAVAEAPARLKEKNDALAKAREALVPLKDSIAKQEAALAQKDGDTKSVTEIFNKGTASVAELTKKLAAQTDEIAKLREARTKIAAESPDYAAADAKVQAKKPELAATQTALDAAQAQLKELMPTMEPRRSELATLGKALEATKVELKTATSAVEAAEKAVATVQAVNNALPDQLAKLRGQSAEIVKAAQDSKAQAESGAARIAGQLDKLKADSERVRAEYESRWKKAVSQL